MIKEEKKLTKFDEGKPRFSMIPQKALKEVAKVFTHGAVKYGEFNYSGEGEVLRYVDALQRHCNQYLTFEDIEILDEHILSISEEEILVKQSIYELTENQISTIKRYI
jgi:hypothetical protein